MSQSLFHHFSFNHNFTMSWENVKCTEKKKKVNWDSPLICCLGSLLPSFGQNRNCKISISILFLRFFVFNLNQNECT